MANPILALVPSGYKVSKVYSIIPDNGSGDFAFSRASVSNTTNSDNLLDEVVTGMPRLDYSNGVNPMLLLEKQAENGVNYSNDFSNGWWYTADPNGVKVNTFTQNATTDPKGGNDGWGMSSARMIGAGGTEAASDHKTTQNLAVTLDEYYTVSLYAKFGTGRYLTFYTQKASSSSFVVTYDLEVGTILFDGIQDQTTGEGSKMEDLGNGWFRCITTFKADATGNAYVAPIISNEDRTTNAYLEFVGDNSISFIYGYQFESGRVATTYIETENGYQTRAVDSCTGSQPSFGATEGTIYLNFLNEQPSQYDDDEYLFTIGNSVSDKIFLRRDSGASTYTFGITNAGTEDLSMVFNIPSGENKLALQYKDQSFKVFLNGSEALSNTNSVSIPTLSEMHLNNFNSDHPNLQLIQLEVYDEAISNQEMAQLTT